MPLFKVSLITVKEKLIILNFLLLTFQVEIDLKAVLPNFCRVGFCQFDTYVQPWLYNIQIVLDICYLGFRLMCTTKAILLPTLGLTSQQMLAQHINTYCSFHYKLNIPY